MFVGIRTFVYSRRKPFDRSKLCTLIEQLPFLSDVPSAIKQAPRSDELASASVAPFKGLVRSKGFVWISGGDDVAYFWSQVSFGPAK